MVGLAITDVSKNENPAFITHISFELKVQTEDDVLRDFLWKIDFLGDGAFFSKKKEKENYLSVKKTEDHHQQGVPKSSFGEDRSE